MAVTKIHAIKTTLSKAVLYIENPDKTDGQLYVSGYNTEPQTASLDFEMTAATARKAHHSKRRSGNLAYHLIQSFSPDDDLTPEQAHELGKKLASEFTQGKYEYVVATHIDKGHLHNHIIINAVSFYDYKKLRTVPYRTARQIRGISDRLCAEAELSVLQEPRQLGQRYTERMRKRTTVPVRSEIRRRLNYVLARAASYDEFKTMAAELGITVKDSGKHIAYLYTGAERAVRGNKLGDTDKYLPEGIREQLAANAENLARLRELIVQAARGAASFSGFQDALHRQGIRTRLDKRTGAVTYIMNDESDSKIPEDALGSGYARSAIEQALQTGDFDLSGTESPPEPLFSRYQKTIRHQTDIHDTLVEVTARQLIRTSRDGVLLAVKDRNGNEARLMLEADCVNGLPDGRTQIALGSGFEYDIVYPDGQHGTVRGADLIRQIELQNGVKPVTVTLGASEIKTMSLKGITVTLPQAGMERIFIPAEYVHYDKLTGSCTADIYQNWDYSYVPVSEEPNPERRSMKGAVLTDTMLTNRQPRQGDDLRSRIAYVERKAKLANARHLAATLMTMSRGQLHTAQDFAPELHRVQQEIQAVAVRISDAKAKNKQYALAARCLTTCQTYKGVWQEYLSTGTLLKPLYSKRHSKELTAYKSALEMLERMEVRPDVDPVKVQALIQDREKQIENDTKHLAELKQTESELMAQRQTVERLQKDTETSVYKGYKRDKIEMRGDRAEISDFPLYLNTVAGGLDRRDQTIGGFSFVVKIYAVPVVEIIG